MIARALQRRRRWRLSAGAALAIAIASALYSHFTSPRDGHDLGGQQAFVQRVIDGDTVVIRQGGTEDRCRLLGIDAPEIAHAGSTDMYFGQEAKRYLAARIEGKAVTLKIDEPETRDRYGRLLAYIYLSDSENVDVSLVRDGMAYADRRFKCSMRSQIEQAEAVARTKKIGLWKNATKADMPPWRQKWMDERHIAQ